MANFLTIASPVEGLYKEKGSKFFSYGFPVQDEEEIKEQLNYLKELHPKARHHCYAYRLGASGEVWKANDAAEPGNSAGMPILNQLKSFELTYILMVVVRYFGGTKLGISGLIQAYKAATAEALSNANIVEDFEKVRIKVAFLYSELSELMQFIKLNNIKLQSQSFEESASLEIEVALEDSQKIKEELSKINKVRIL